MPILLRINMLLGNVASIHTDPRYIFNVLELLCTEFLKSLLIFIYCDQFINLLKGTVKVYNLS